MSPYLKFFGAVLMLACVPAFGFLGLSGMGPIRDALGANHAATYGCICLAGEFLSFVAFMWFVVQDTQS